MEPQAAAPEEEKKAAEPQAATQEEEKKEEVLPPPKSKNKKVKTKGPEQPEEKVKKGFISRIASFFSGKDSDEDQQ